MEKDNERAWNTVAAKYAAAIDSDVKMLKSGGSGLLPMEIETLGPLLQNGGRAIHLQCSHGLDALSLRNLGATDIVGVDISENMLELAKKKSAKLGVNATWVHADVLHVPRDLDGTATLVYTGKGALPWVSDLTEWASVVARLLEPGGHFYMFEGHPMNWMWDPHADHLRLRDADYFDRAGRVNDDFPGLFLKNASVRGDDPVEAFEHQWTLGDIVTELIGAQLRVVSLREYPEHFWPQFPRVDADDLRRLPHTFSLLMQRV